MLAHEADINLFTISATTKSRRVKFSNSCVKPKHSSEPKFWDAAKREISDWLKKFRGDEEK